MRSSSSSLLAGCLAAGVLTVATGCDSAVGKLLSHHEEQAFAAEPTRRDEARTAPKLAAVSAPATPASAASAPAPSAPAPAAAKAVACDAPAIASGVNSSQGPAGAGEASEHKFAFKDDEYLLPSQSDGGLVYVPGAVPAGASVPLVIFLHGTNANGPLHRGLGSGKGLLTSSAEIEAGYDLRPVVQDLIDQKTITPVMVGGPSQNREAGHGHDLWPAFDPSAFADAVDRSLGDRARVDRERVIVVGHSGAGCSPVGGGLVGLAQRLGRSSEHTPPRALVAIDTCLDEWVADAFADATQSTPVWVYFQTATWDRPFDPFKSRFLPSGGDVPGAAGDIDRRRVVTIEGLSGDAAHNLALPRGLRLALPALVPPRACP